MDGAHMFGKAVFLTYTIDTQGTRAEEIETPQILHAWQNVSIKDMFSI